MPAGHEAAELIEGDMSNLTSLLDLNDTFPIPLASHQLCFKGCTALDILKLNRMIFFKKEGNPFVDH